MTEPLFCISRSTVCGRDPLLHCMPRQALAPAADCPDGLPIVIQIGGGGAPLRAPAAAPEITPDPQKTRITADILNGLKVLAALVTAASALAWAVVRVGIHFSLERVGFAADDLGGRGNVLAGSLGVGCAMTTAAAIVAVAITVIAKLLRFDRRLKRHTFGSMTGKAAAWCVNGLLAAAVSIGLMVVEETKTIGLTLRDPVGSASRVFLGGYVMAAGASAALLAFSVAVYVKPGVFEATAEQLTRVKARARDHVAGNSVFAGLLLAACMVALSLVASAAVTVQLRAGHPPGIVGSWLGADVECVRLSRPLVPDVYVLYVGRHDKQSLFLQNGHTVLRLADQEIADVNGVPDSECWLPSSKP